MSLGRGGRSFNMNEEGDRDAVRRAEEREGSGYLN